MLQFLLNVAGFGPIREHRESETSWRRDPLAHPALRAMDARELGDLPIGHPFVPCADA